MGIHKIWTEANVKIRPFQCPPNSFYDAFQKALQSGTQEITFQINKFN